MNKENPFEEGVWDIEEYNEQDIFRERISKRISYSKPSYPSLKISYLNLRLMDLKSLDGIEQFKNLQVLDLSYNSIGDISLKEYLKPLKNLKKLKQLYLGNNYIYNVNGLGYLSNLKLLDLKNNNISNLDGLYDLKNLEELNLDNNKIRTLQNLSKLENLKKLTVRNNLLKELYISSKNKKLNIINVNDNHINDINIFTSLKQLSVHNNNITSISHIRKIIKFDISVSITVFMKIIFIITYRKLWKLIGKIGI